ncbi:hypothetical protein HDU76_007274 [Blyttiomyces sp. JEL0837]|nr:hypothetical protein HDU76_007274 [Blyttiomyces sp. JEL0837]
MLEYLSKSRESILHLRSFPSFRRHIMHLAKTNNVSQARRLITDDDYFLERLPTYIKGVWQFHRDLEFFLEMVHSLRRLTEKSMKLPRLFVYSKALQLHEDDIKKYFSNLNSRILTLSAPNLKTLLDEWKAAFVLYSGKALSAPFTDASEEVAQNMKILDEIIKELHENISENENTSDSDTSQDHLGLVPSKPRQARNTRVSTTLKPISWESFERTSTDKKLVDIVTVPFHEVFYFSDWKMIKKACFPHPAATVQTALGVTHHYLNCPCCSKSNDVETWEDISIIYRLYLEFGEMINLHDWLSAFVLVAEKQNTDITSNSDIRSRFVRAITVMNFLGLIKQTTRKVDHVVRQFFES